MASTEKKLKESEEKFKALFKGGLVPTYAWQKVGDSFKLIDYNNAASNITQGNVQDFIGIKASEMYKERLDILEDINNCFDKKITISREMLYYFSSLKEEKDLLVKYAFLPPDLVLVHTEDITERKLAEQKLKESEENYRKLFENMNAGFAYHKVLTDNNNKPIDYEYIEVNPAFEKLTGLKREFLIGKRVTEAIPGTENDPADWIGRFGNVGLTGIPLTVEEYSEAIKKWFKVSGYSPRKGFFAVTFTDITDIKIVTQKLKESEEKYRNLFDSAPFAVVLFNIEGIILDCNDAASKITGYSKEELIGNDFRSFNFYVDIKSANLEERQKQTSSGNTPKPREVLLYRKDGSEFWGRSHIEFVHIREKPYLQAIIHDITEQKRSTINLHESEHRLQERVKELNFLFGISKIAEKQNLSYKEFLRETVNLIPTAMQFPDLTRVRIIFEDNEFKSANFKTTNWKLTTQVEINERSLSIEIYYLEDNPFLPEEENLIIEIGKRLKSNLEKKVSELKRISAQTELEKSYERLKELENIINKSPGVLFLWQNSEGWPVEFVSENVNQFGYTQEDFYSGKVIYEEIVHPDDLERVAEEVNIHSNEDINEFVQEYRIITKSGKVKWLDDRTWIRRDSEGNITHFQGIVIDITDRKNAEEALKFSERNYKDAYDQANFYKDLFTHDMNNILQIVNSSAELISFQLVDSEKSKYIGSMTNMIRNQVERGSKLISNVRTLSELEEAKVTTNPIEVSTFLKNSVDYVINAYSESQIYIAGNYLEEKISITANELLQDVFENILINAIKYNENTRIEISIMISKQKMDGSNNIKIEFIDNGIGVADDRKEVIFKPGHREYKGTKGMGLGLSLVSKILSIFNGKIWVEDKIRGDYTKGSKFIILIPELK